MNQQEEAAARYAVDLEWTIVPCASGSERPYLTGWPEWANSDEWTIRGHWQRSPNDLIGLVPGKCNLVGVDVDVKGDADGLATWRDIEAHNPGIGETVRGDTPSGGRRYIFSANGRVVASRKWHGLGIEIFGAKGQFLIPPAPGYTWDEGYGPFERDPAPWPKSVQLPANLSAGAGPQPLPEKVMKGEQNNDACSLAGTMANRGADAETIFAAFKSRSDRHYEPPGRDEKLREVARHYDRLGARKGLGPGELDRLLKFHVVSLTQYLGDNVQVVMETDRGTVILGDIGGLSSLYRFRQRVLSALHIYVTVPKGKWGLVVQALADLMVDEGAPESTDRELMDGWLRDYLGDCRPMSLADARERRITRISSVALRDEEPHLPDGDGHWCISLSALSASIYRQCGERVGLKRVARLLHQMGARGRRLSIGGWVVRVWWVPDELTGLLDPEEWEDYEPKKTVWVRVSPPINPSDEAAAAASEGVDWPL